MTNDLGPDDPGAQDECATCGHARWRHKEVDGQQVCTEYVNCACGGHFVELPQATRMVRVIQAAGLLAEEFATFRASLSGTMQALHQLHHAMQVAGLLPEEQAEQPAGRHHARITGPTPDPKLMQEIHDTVSRTGLPLYRVAQVFDIPRELLDGPSPDGLPDHWTMAAPLTDRITQPTDMETPIKPGKWYAEHTAQQLVDEHTRRGIPVPPDAGMDVRRLADSLNAHDRPNPPAPMSASCPTCWPRPCDPSRSMCRRNPDVTQVIQAVIEDSEEPMLCDGCGRTDHPVTASPDGRALLCPTCQDALDKLTDAVADTPNPEQPNPSA